MACWASGCWSSSTSAPPITAGVVGRVAVGRLSGERLRNRLARVSSRLWLKPLSRVRLCVTPAMMPFSGSGLVSPELWALAIIFLMNDCWRLMRARSLSASETQRPLT